jgi:diaminohydroxyphosphoribosylaminopyrimidine deaminase/5-amino-6-(5-phosphoribosylamino)uracil reductase
LQADLDAQLMRRALRLAAQSIYLTSPNPRVGCVIVRDGVVLGEGSTQRAGGNHAEIEAINAALAAGHHLAGATAYVTLEPCSHFGRTPPCVNALIAHKLVRVVAAVEDPNPMVSGQGLQRLHDAGIEVQCGLLAEEAREINIGFFSRMLRGRPWVRMKVAASLDGITALADGQSQWITGEAARADGHHYRAMACAVLTGVGTLLADNPQLNVRAVSTPRQPAKVLVDSRLDAPLAARYFAGGAVTVFCGQADDARVHAFESAGHSVVPLPDEQGKVDLAAMMQELGKRQINELHVEAGYKLNGSLIRASMVDELVLYVAPQLLGQGQGLAAIGPLALLKDAVQLDVRDVARVGNDLRIIARFNHSRF